MWKLSLPCSGFWDRMLTLLPCAIPLFPPYTLVLTPMISGLPSLVNSGFMDALALHNLHGRCVLGNCSPKLVSAFHANLPSPKIPVCIHSNPPSPPPPQTPCPDTVSLIRTSSSRFLHSCSSLLVDTHKAVPHVFPLCQSSSDISEWCWGPRVS